MIRLVLQSFSYLQYLIIVLAQFLVTLNEKVILESNHEIQLYQSLSIIEFFSIVEI